MSTRIRRAPADLRAAAIAEARRLLIERGPDGITLQAVAAGVGTAHGNLTHHFGAVANLHAALAETMARELTAAVAAALPGARANQDPAAVVDMVFDACAQRGGARLVAWLASTGRTDLLQPVFAAISEFLDRIADDHPWGRDAAARAVAAVFLPALAAALVGDQLAGALGLAPKTWRDLAAAHLETLRTP